MAGPQDIIDAATRAGLSPDLAAWVPQMVQIESGGNPNNRTGSYSGLLQLGPAERKQYGGDSLDAGLNLLRDRAQQFEAKFGRPPDPAELYLTHQQGLGGLSAHVANPDAPAWQNMAGTGEGRQKGAGWARQAIWGNIPTQFKGQFGSVDNVTSQQFMDMWRNRLQGIRPASIAGNIGGPAPSPSIAPSGTPAAPAMPAGVPSAVALAQAQPQSAPFFPGAAQAPVAAAAPASPAQGVAGDVARMGQDLLAPKMSAAALMKLQLPPAFRPRIPQLPNTLATLKPTLFFPRG